MEKLNFKFDYNIPKLNNTESYNFFKQALVSHRKRYPFIIHKKGEYFNQVFNFILEDSYMRPHHHPLPMMVEKMHLIKGEFKVLIFGDNGEVLSVYSLKKRGERIQIPPFTWHTYVMKQKQNIIFETMNGVYDSKTWKVFPEWAPEEGNIESVKYFDFLKQY